MPAALQFAELPSLQDLTLYGVRLSASMDALLRQTGIYRVCLHTHLPPGLAGMTQLRQLELVPCGPPEVDAASWKLRWRRFSS